MTTLGSRDAKGGSPEVRQRSCSLCERIRFLAESSWHGHTGGGFVTRAAREMDSLRKRDPTAGARLQRRELLRAVTQPG